MHSSTRQEKGYLDSPQGGMSMIIRLHLLSQKYSTKFAVIYIYTTTRQQGADILTSFFLAVAKFPCTRIITVCRSKKKSLYCSITSSIAAACKNQKSSIRPPRQLIKIYILCKSVTTNILVLNTTLSLKQQPSLSKDWEESHSCLFTWCPLFIIAVKNRT